ncbi:trigger factor [Luteipulveratus halotolerans]|uniref:Trigger factor n=1 Tax=Luteipulveratus halotolerans TaxID=1631356 RepID=A0A0L6CFX1_9MICO|nr:trigger factor [Luteipulveratus halotolerans]KNX36726.1 trigger factor [Luteipulveratus halotolerans]
MKSAVENLNPTRVKLTVEVPYEELKPSLDAAYKTIGQQIQIPGFRKGKVPARIIDQRVGRGAVIQEAVNEALPEFFGKAVDEHDVSPLGQPEVDITQVPAAEGDDLHFIVEVDTRPEITLPDYDGISVEVEPFEVSDQDIEDELGTLRERFGTLVGVERAATKGDFVSIDLKATIGDDEIDSVNGVSYEVGSGNMLEGLDEALEGAKAGDTKTFTAPLAGGDHAGEDAECVVTVESVKERQLPELDDEFAQLASEHDTLDELKDDVRGQVEQRKRFEQGVQARDKVLDHLLDTLDIAVPESIVESEVHSHLEGEDRLEDDEHRAEVQESTRKALQTQFLLDEIVAKDEVQVSQEELIEYLIMSAQQYGMDPNQFAQALDQQGQVPAVMGEVARRKALSTVLEKVTVKDTNGEVVDLNALNTDEDEVEDDQDVAEATTESAEDAEPAKA